MSILKFFGSLASRKREPLLSQVQNEAVVDALTFAMMIDLHVAAQEQARVKKLLDRLKWRSAFPLEQSINSGIRRAREVLEGQRRAPGYCQSIGARLGSDSLQEETFELALQIVRSDDVLVPEERALLEIMSVAFELDPELVKALLNDPPEQA